MTARVRALALILAVTPVIASTGLTVRPAFAQDDPAITAEARKRFLEGVKLFDEKKFEPARAAFVQAYALKKHPDVLLNLASAEVLSGHALEAAGHYRDFLRDPATASHPKRGDAERGLADARAKIGRLQVTVDVADAEVFVDGKKVGSSPLGDPVDVAVGQHGVEAKKNGKSATQTLMAPEGKITIVSLSVEGGTPPVAVPPTKDEPKKDEPKKDEPKKDEPKKEPKKDEPKGDDSAGGSGHESFLHWAKRSPVAYVGVGLTGVGLGLGIIMSIQAGNANDSATKLTNDIKTAAARDNFSTAGICKNPPDARYQSACNNLQSNLDANSSDKSLATVGFVLAGVGVATVVGGYFITRRTSDEDAKRTTPGKTFAVAPVLSPTMAGFGAGGTF